MRFAFVLLLLTYAPLAAQSNGFGVTYDNLRGTNYVFNSTHLVQNEIALLSFPGDGPATPRIGTYSRKNVESELKAIADAGFNNVRVTPSFYNWVIDQAQTLRNLTHFVATCRQNRLTITWVLWTGIGSARSWNQSDLADVLDNNTTATTNDALHRTVILATLDFTSRHATWTPKGHIGYASGYPAPGNNLLRRGGDPSKWTKGAMHVRTKRFVEALMGLLTTKDGRATLFQIDLGNELDTVNIPLAHAIAFLKWNETIVRRFVPNAQTTVGWAEIDTKKYAAYVAALDQAGIRLSRHSFHYFAKSPTEYKSVVEPFLRWARHRSRPLKLIVSEFYRVDTPEWHHLDDTFRFFEDHHVPTIMWGYLGSNLFTDPKVRNGSVGPFIDGVMDASNLNGVQSIHKTLRFVPRSAADHAAVLAYNRVGGRRLPR